MKFNFIGKKRKSDCIALFPEQVNNGRSRINRECQFIDFRGFTFFEREKHGRGSVDHNLAAKIGFFFILFHE